MWARISTGVRLVALARKVAHSGVTSAKALPAR